MTKVSNLNPASFDRRNAPSGHPLCNPSTFRYIVCSVDHSPSPKDGLDDSPENAPIIARMEYEMSLGFPPERDPYIQAKDVASTFRYIVCSVDHSPSPKDGLDVSETVYRDAVER
jgi:hypothetical protein